MAQEEWWKQGAVPVKETGLVEAPVSDTDTNWWTQGAVPDSPVSTPSITPVVDQPEEPYSAKSFMRDQADIKLNENGYGRPVNEDMLGTEPVGDATQSKTELYGDIDASPRYEKLRVYEDSLLNKVGNLSFGKPGERSSYNLGGRYPEDIERLKNERDSEKQKRYESTGTQDTIAGFPVGRSQEVLQNNQDFDPSKTPGETNPPMVKKNHSVDPPDRELLTRIGLQVAKNIVAGVGDFGKDLVTKGEVNLVEEGDLGRRIPDQVPDETGEKLASDIATFVVGPKVVGKVFGGIGGTGAMVAQKFSPKTVDTIRNVYQTTLEATKNTALAQSAAAKYTKMAIYGTALGVQEAMVAPSGSEGMVPPDWIAQQTGLDMDEAQNLSFMIDTPIVGGVVRSLGAGISGAKNLTSNALGGLREVNLAGLRPFKSAFMDEKRAGLKTLLWLDPNLQGQPASVFGARVKILGDALAKNATLNAQLDAAGKKIDFDTPTAFIGVADQYYRTAYQNLRDSKTPEEFENWIKDQVTGSSQRLVELRTKMNGETETMSATGRTARQINELRHEGSNTLAGGDLIDAQMRSGQTMGDEALRRMEPIDTRITMAEREAQVAEDLKKTAITGDEEFKTFLDELGNEGSQSGARDLVKGNITDKTYKAFSKMKSDTDAAYKKIADTGVEGEPSSLLQIIRGDAGTVPVGQTSGNAKLDKVLQSDPEAAAVFEKLGGPRKAVDSEDGQVAKITNPFLKDIAEEIEADPSFGNIYNKVRIQVNKRIEAIKKTNPSSDELYTLQKLSDNIENDQIDFIKKSGVPKIDDLVNDAKGKYIAMRQAFYDDEGLVPISNRAAKRMSGDPDFGSKLPVGPYGPQRATDFRRSMARAVENGLEGADGELFRESIEKANKMGGQDISGDLHYMYVSKAISNLAKNLENGAPETIATLNNALSGSIEPLRRMGSPFVERVQAMKSKIEMLSNTSTDKQQILKGIQEDSKALRDDITASMFWKYTHEGKPVQQAEAAREMVKMFRSPHATSDITRMLDEASKLGDQGKIIRQSLQGTYNDYIFDRVTSKRQIGVTGVDNGVLETDYRINESNFQKVFEPGSLDMNNLEVIFKDKPEVINQIKELSETYLNATKTSPHAKDTLSGQVPADQDPTRGINTAINLLVGPLNRTGSRLRAITGPMAVNSMEQVKNGNAQVLLAILNSPVRAAEIFEMARKGVVTADQKAEFADLVSKAVGRTMTTNIGSDEEDQLAVPPKLKNETENILKMK